MDDKKHWYDWLWVLLLLYVALSFYNILFGWLGLFFIFAPILVTAWKGTKIYCNRYCGRGQFFQLIGSRFGTGSERQPPRFLRTRWFRYATLILFVGRFVLLLDASVAALMSSRIDGRGWAWLWDHPWDAASTILSNPASVMLAHGLYGAMLVSTIVGAISMVILRPRAWCVYCPMGTVTQGICRIRHRHDEA